MKPSVFKTAAALLAAPLVLLGAHAEAAAKLVSETPAAGAAVGMPQAITLKFDETLNPGLSDADLTTESGTPIPVSNKADDVTLVATPQTILAPGRYEVLWRAVDAAGDRTRNVYDFVVR